MTGIKAADRFCFFATCLSQSITQSSGGRNDMDPKTCVVTQAPLKEEEKKDDLGQSNTMPGSFELLIQNHRFLADLVGKYLDDYLTLLHVK